MNKKAKRWILQENELQARQLSKEINIPIQLALALLNRNVNSYDAARKFFRPKVSDIYDPFLMDDMEPAVNRVIHAIVNHERIMIFGDYDVDGTSGVAMLTLFFKSHGLDVISYIPDRIKEGYGISNKAIDYATSQGINLIISVDCGITAVEQIEYGHSVGIDFIICDHHEPEEKIPNAIAVLDPLKPNCNYPFKYLCGCGVAFKLLHGISVRLREENKVFEYLDYVALATAADIVPLIDENRVLTKLGLEKINSNPRPSLIALIKTSGIEFGKVNTGHIVFILAPRINAVGRLGDASRAVNLLTAENDSIAQELAEILENENRTRREIDEATYLEAQAIVDQLIADVDNSAIVLHNHEWHPGVIGIVASRLVEKYYLPTIMMTTVDGIAKGSARSIAGFDIYQALKRVEDKIIVFGGHKFAAGLSVELDKIGEFREAFKTAVKEMMTDDIRTPSIVIDAEITLDEINSRFIKILREFAPYGPGNLRATFLTRNVECIGVPKIVGNNHLKFRVRQNQFVFNAIGFELGALIDNIKGENQKLDIVFSIDDHEISAYSDEKIPINSTIKLKLKDVQISNQTY